MKNLNKYLMVCFVSMLGQVSSFALASEPLSIKGSEIELSDSLFSKMSAEELDKVLRTQNEIGFSIIADNSKAHEHIQKLVQVSQKYQALCNRYQQGVATDNAIGQSIVHYCSQELAWMKNEYQLLLPQVKQTDNIAKHSEKLIQSNSDVLLGIEKMKLYSQTIEEVNKIIQPMQTIHYELTNQ